MSELVMIKNNQVVVSSRQVAEKFGKKHYVVLNSIKEILGQARKISSDSSQTSKSDCYHIKTQNCVQTYFKATTYTSGTGKRYPMYLMNRDGFSLLTMGFTGTKAMQWKIAYINAFNEMEKQLRERQKPKQISLIELPKEFVKPSMNYEFMKKYAAVQAYLTVANDMFKDLKTSRTKAEHEGALKTAVEIFSRMAWTCCGLQDVKLELYSEIN